MKQTQQPPEPLASFEALVWAKNQDPSGEYQLRVGSLCITSPEYYRKDAEKWLPVIVESVNALAGIPDPAAALKAAREALEFYARMGDDVVYRDQVEFDNGHKAAAALAALKGEQP